MHTYGINDDARSTNRTFFLKLRLRKKDQYYRKNNQSRLKATEKKIEGSDTHQNHNFWKRHNIYNYRYNEKFNSYRILLRPDC